jgi:hypothetical protein
MESPAAIFPRSAIEASQLPETWGGRVHLRIG